MSGELRIRREAPPDHRPVEELTRDAFWDVNVPGCSEHYLAHILRGHEDFVPELDLVAELGGVVIGNVMYTRSRLAAGTGEERQILTFGPVSIHPAHQRKGYGRALLEESFRRARELGYELVVIFGSPANYSGLGFQSCRKHNICAEGGVYPTAMLVKELRLGVLDGRRWTYRESPAYRFDPLEAEKFDEGFPRREKGYRTSQEEFYIYSHSTLR